VRGTARDGEQDDAEWLLHGPLEGRGVPDSPPLDPPVVLATTADALTTTGRSATFFHVFATALAISLLAFSSASASSCTHSQLRVGHGPGQGSAGHLHWPIVFRNTSATACSLRGFPGVSALSGRHGHRIGVPASRDRAGRVRRILLAAHSGIASAAFTQTNVDVFDPAQCHPKRAKGLRVFAPGQVRSFYVRLSHRVCSTAPDGPDSTVRAVVAGSTGL
jgi:hypothetical protein